MPFIHVTLYNNIQGVLKWIDFFNSNFLLTVIAIKAIVAESECLEFLLYVFSFENQMSSASTDGAAPTVLTCLYLKLK